MSIHLLEARDHACLQSRRRRTPLPASPGREGTCVNRAARSLVLVSSFWRLQPDTGAEGWGLGVCAEGTMQALFAQLQLSPSPLLHHTQPPPSFSAVGREGGAQGLY